MKVNPVARVGAVAAVMGLSLAGPQALGVAVADNPDREGSSATSAPGDSAAAGQSGAAARADARHARPATRGPRARTAQPAEAPEAGSAEIGSPSPPRTAERTSGAAPARIARPAASTTDRQSLTPAAGQVQDVPDVPAGATTPRALLPSTPAVTSATSVPARSALRAKTPVPGLVTPEAAASSAGSLPTPGQIANAAVIGVFDAVTGFLDLFRPNPISDFISGALLLVRRTLLNQAPTADPFQFALNADGREVGSIGAVDPQGAALTYTVKTAPTNGTVALTADGTWTYTPTDPDAVFQGDRFTVTVSNGLVNVFTPTSVDVTVPLDAVMSSVDKRFVLNNLTPHNMTVTAIGDQSDSRFYRGPKVGWVFEPGAELYAEFIQKGSPDGSAYIAFGDSRNSWTVNFDFNSNLFVNDRIASCPTSATCAIDSKGERALLGDPAGEQRFTAATPGAQDLYKVLQRLDNGKTHPSWDLKGDFKDPVVDDRVYNTEFTDYEPVVNTSDSGGTVRTVTFTKSVTTTEGSSWAIGGEVGVSIKGIINLAVSAEFKKTYDVSKAKVETYLVQQTVSPWSYSGYKSIPPTLWVSGDVTYKFESIGGGLSNVGPTYIFEDVAWTVPDPRSKEEGNPGWSTPNVFQEPIQNEANQGFKLADARDPGKPNSRPIYQTGETGELALWAFTTGFNGGSWGRDAADFTTGRNVVYSSSNTAVAQVDSEFGEITAVGPGTAVITARYTWANELPSDSDIGPGKNQVFATMTVRVR